VFSGRTVGRQGFVSVHHGFCPAAETQSADVESCAHLMVKLLEWYSIQTAQIISYQVFTFLYPSMLSVPRRVLHPVKSLLSWFYVGKPILTCSYSKKEGR